MIYARKASVKGKDSIIVESSWHDKDIIKQIPGSRWNAELKAWTFPLSWAACLQLRGTFGDDLRIDQQLNEWAYAEIQARITPAVDARDRTQPIWPDRADDRLYPFQQAGVEFGTFADNMLLTDEMGTGKTIQLLTLLRRQHLVECGNETLSSMLPGIVICPNAVKKNWANEAEKWFPEATPYPMLGSALQRKKTLAAAAKDPTALVILNIEAVRQWSRLAPYGSIQLSRCRECDPKNGNPGINAARCHVHKKELNGFGFKSFIIDEAHRIKNPQSQQTRAIWAVAHDPSITRRYGATGTPIANSPDDLWSLMHCLVPDEYPTKSKFVDRYCLQSWNNFGGLDVVGIRPDMRDEFFKILDPRFRRMPKSLVLKQLPPKIRSVRYVDLLPKQRRAYDALKKEQYAEIDKQLLVARNDIELRLRLMQLSSTWLSVAEDGITVRMRDPSPKIDELLEVHEELGGKQYVVSAESRQLIELAYDRYTKAGIRVVQITGAIGEWERARNLENFQDGREQVLMFTLKAGGTGLTMTAADTMVCLQRSDSLIDNKQGEDRIHRIGSERHESVHIIDIVASDTVEEKQVVMLHEKFERLQAIVRDRELLIAAGEDPSQLDNFEAEILAHKIGM